MTKLQTIIDNAAAVGGSQIDVGMWAMIFEMVLEFMQACSERNSPEAIEGFVRADDTRQIEAMGRRELRKQFREEYGRWGWRAKWQQARGSIKVTLNAARDADAGTIADIAGNPMA
jgi:hypothetical protein